MPKTESPSTNFDKVDTHANAAGLVDYLEIASQTPSIREYKATLTRMAEIKPGDHFLEVGCGNGVDIRAAVNTHGNSVKITGIDSSRTMLTETRALLTEEFPTNRTVRLLQMDAQRMALAPNSFDITKADRVFQHLPSAVKALSEMIRITKPGGKVLVADTHWNSMVVKGISRADSNVIKKTYLALTKDPYVAAHLGKLMTAGGLILDEKKDIVRTQITQDGYQAVEDALWIDDSLQKGVALKAITPAEYERCLTNVTRVKEENPESLKLRVPFYIARGYKK